MIKITSVLVDKKLLKAGVFYRRQFTNYFYQLSS